jgi:hypothetical protein
MALTQPWYRFYIETPDDEKLDMAAEMAGCEYDTVLATWVILMTFAKRSPDEGYLLIAKSIPLPEIRIAKKLRRPDQVDLVIKILEAFEDLDMLAKDNGVVKLAHWHERQYKSDSSTPRVREHRKGKGGNVPPAPDGNVSAPEGGNGPEAEAEKETEIEQREDEVIAGEIPVEKQARGKFINEDEAEGIYRKVTGFMSIPSLSRENAIRIICDIAYRKGDETANYLKPFYYEWINPLRKRENGMPYSRTGIGWLDWAAVGQIPPLEAPKVTKLTASKPITIDPRKAALEDLQRRTANGEPI